MTINLEFDICPQARAVQAALGCYNRTRLDPLAVMPAVEHILELISTWKEAQTG